MRQSRGMNCACQWTPVTKYCRVGVFLSLFWKRSMDVGNSSWDNLHWNWHVSELFAEFEFSNKKLHLLSWKINSYCPSCILENNISLDSRPHWARSQHINSYPSVAYHYRNGTSLFPICFQAIQYLYSRIFSTPFT